MSGEVTPIIHYAGIRIAAGRVYPHIEGQSCRGTHSHSRQLSFVKPAKIKSVMIIIMDINVNDAYVENR